MLWNNPGRWLGVILMGGLASASLSAQTPGISLQLIPDAPVLKSWMDFSGNVEVAKPEQAGGNITSEGFEIREAASGKRVAVLDAAGSGLSQETGPDDFSISEWTSHLGGLAAGDFLVAYLINGERASNVVTVKIDPEYDLTKAPVLQLGVLEPGGPNKYSQPLLWLTAPTPSSAELSKRNFDTKAVVSVDDAPHRAEWKLNSSPFATEILSEEQDSVAIDPGALKPAVDPAKIHTYAVEVGPFKAAPLRVDPAAHPLNDAWDQATLKLKDPADPAPVVVTYEKDWAAMGRKLKTIIIPKVALDNARLGDATLALMALSKEADPDHRGVYIGLDQLNIKWAFGARISFAMENASLAAILDKLCEANGWTYTISSQGVLISL